MLEVVELNKVKHYQIVEREMKEIEKNKQYTDLIERISNNEPNNEPENEV